MEEEFNPPVVDGAFAVDPKEHVVSENEDSDGDSSETEEEYSPRRGGLTSTSPYVRIERFFGIDHGDLGEPGSGEKEPIISLACHPVDANTIATGGHDGIVRLWKVLDSSSRLFSLEDYSGTRTQQVSSLSGHMAQVNAVRFSPVSGAMLASCSSDTTIRVYSRSGGWKLLHSLRSHTLDVTDIAWFSEKYLISCSADGKCILWDAVTGGKLQTLQSTAAGAVPKGLVVDTALSSLLVMYDDNLLDVFTWRSGESKFRHSRHLNLAIEDGGNFSKSSKTSIYPKRGSWLSLWTGGVKNNYLLCPMGMRSREGPCGVLYERSNLVEPTPGESLLAEKVIVGHPGRVVVVSCKPGAHVLVDQEEDTNGSHPTIYSVFAMVSVDGVLSLWMAGSACEIRAMCVVANLFDPLAVCTDAAWMEDTLYLSSSDGAITSVRLQNLGSRFVPSKSDLSKTIPTISASAVPDQQNSQIETVGFGGKRRIQPLIVSAPMNAATAPAPSSLQVNFPSELISKCDTCMLVPVVKAVNNSDSQGNPSFTVNNISGQGTLTAVCHDNTLLCYSFMDKLGNYLVRFSLIDCANPANPFSEIIMPSAVVRLKMTTSGAGGLPINLIVQTTVPNPTLAVWTISNGSISAPVPDAPLTGMFANDTIEDVDFVDGALVVKLANSGKYAKYLGFLCRWSFFEYSSNHISSAN